MAIDVDALADELAALCRRLDMAESARAASDDARLADDRRRLREIGELAHQQGGSDLMLQLVYVASWTYRNTVETTNTHCGESAGGDASEQAKERFDALTNAPRFVTAPAIIDKRTDSFRSHTGRVVR